MPSLRLSQDVEALVHGYLEGSLTPGESTRLLAAVKADPTLVQVILEGLRMDVSIRKVVGSPDFVTRAVELEKDQPTGAIPRVEGNAGGATAARQPGVRGRRRQQEPHGSRRFWLRPTSLAWAACVAALLGLIFWFFTPTLGEPVVAEIHGADLFVERGDEWIRASVGIRLARNDVLHTGTNSIAVIAFKPENTRLVMHPTSDLKFASLTDGKRFELRTGRLDASVARQRPFRPMIITTAHAEIRVLGTEFILTVSTNQARLDVSQGRISVVRLNDQTAAKVGAGEYTIVAAQTELKALPQTGHILREYWTNVAGIWVRDLEKDPRFPKQPSGRELLKGFESPLNWADNYGLRIRGYVHPPVTGDYTFWTAGSTEFYLFISPDDDSAGAACVCYGGNMRPRDFDQPQTNEKARKSPPIHMIAGRRYYIEALLKAAFGEDHLSVAWRIPGRDREIISGEYLSPFKP